MIFGLPLAVAGLIGIATIGVADNVRLSQTYDMSKCTYPGAGAKSKNHLLNQRSDNVPTSLPANVRVCEVKK
jgi:hypothetical protein